MLLWFLRLFPAYRRMEEEKRLLAEELIAAQTRLAEQISQSIVLREDLCITRNSQIEQLVGFADALSRRFLGHSIASTIPPVEDEEEDSALAPLRNGAATTSQLLEARRQQVYRDVEEYMSSA